MIRRTCWPWALAGLVSYHGTWRALPRTSSDVIPSDQPRDKVIREYLDRRTRAPHNADAQFKLAAWCAEHGLKDQALAHYNEVTRIDPSRETAWKHLGYSQANTIAGSSPRIRPRQKVEAEREKHADQHWKPRLEKLRAWLQEFQARSGESKHERAWPK